MKRPDLGGRGADGDGELTLAFPLLADAVQAAVLVVDRKGQLRYVSRRARELMGLAEDAKLASLKAMPTLAAVATRAGRDPGPWDLEMTIDLRDGAIPVRISTQPIARGGRVVASLVVITDLRSGVSTIVAERDRALQNDRAKTRSLHMVAHDLSGPLTVLKGYVSLVLDGTIEVQELEPHIPMLGEQVEHMQRLVQVLLDTARLEEGRLELELEPLDLVQFVEALIASMRPPETGHVLVVRREAPALPIMADPIRLDSVIRNIVSNAIKYSPEGSTVTCTLRRERGTASLEVADQGRGIEGRQLDLLFSRFGRVGDVTGHPGGVGLGLFLSRELARLHGGDVDVASEVGIGSKFTLRLPLRRLG